MDTAAVTTIDEANEIMGRNLHSPHVTEANLGVTFAPNEWDRLQEVPFGIDVLHACSTTHVLVACSALSLTGVWRQQHALFDEPDEWFTSKRVDMWFSTKTVMAGWQLVRKNPVPNSTNKTLDEQQALLGENEKVPTASVLAQAIILHFLETGERLLDDCNVRTADVFPNGNRVIIGSLDEETPVTVFGLLDGGSNYASLGLASAHKLV